MKEVITTADAPEAVGAYSQAVRVGNLVVTAGQIALIPGEMRLDNKDIPTETRRIMSNLSAVLAAAGCTFEDVIRSRIYITDKRIFSEVNAVYKEYFAPGNEPVRECVVAAPPLDDTHVEISMDAYVER